MTSTTWRSLLASIAIAAQCGVGPPAQAGDAGAPALLAEYAQRKAALARSPFKRPLLLESSAAPDRPHGDVFAVLDQPFPQVAAVLSNAARWCDVFILQTNVKRCAASDDASGRLLRVAVVRRFDMPVTDAYELAFRFSLRTNDAHQLSVQLAADSGPLGTRDYRLVLEAVPLDAGRSFIHMSYAYANGLAARLATDAYLASAGSSKVGFTVTGQDASGRPSYVGGVQGVAERNTMRYFIAIEALLQSPPSPAEDRLEARLRGFHAAIEQYPDQLHEMSSQDYLAMKRRETQAR